MTGPERSPAGPDDGEDGVVRATFDWETVSPSAAVVETVASATDREHRRVGPLYDAVDPDALDAFIDPDGAGGDTEARRASFEFAGRHVTVFATGEVVVHPTE